MAQFQTRYLGYHENDEFVTHYQLEHRLSDEALYTGTHVQTGHHILVKLAQKDVTPDHITNESQRLTKLCHKNIIKASKIAHSKRGKPALIFENLHEPYLLSELIDAFKESDIYNKHAPPLRLPERFDPLFDQLRKEIHQDDNMHYIKNLSNLMRFDDHDGIQTALYHPKNLFIMLCKRTMNELYDSLSYLELKKIQHNNVNPKTILIDTFRGVQLFNFDQSTTTKQPHNIDWRNYIITTNKLICLQYSDHSLIENVHRINPHEAFHALQIIVNTTKLFALRNLHPDWPNMNEEFKTLTHALQKNKITPHSSILQK